MDMINMSRGQLEARFEPVKDVREVTLWGGVSTIYLTLVPKGSAGYKYAASWIDSRRHAGGQTGLLTGMPPESIQTSAYL